MAADAGTSVSTSSFAVLGLLAIRPWTAYDLAQQMQRSLRWAWPRSERHAYDEPKRLVKLGLATATTTRRGRRARTEYRITPAGREALRAWLTTEPAVPALEIEALLRLLYADQGSAEDLRGALAASRRRIDQEVLPMVLAQVRGYVDSGGPFPERLHLIALFADFYGRFIDLFEEWSDQVIAEVDRWPSTRAVGLTPHGEKRLEAILERFGDRA